MAWIKFKRPDILRDRAERPEASIWKKGIISFTKAAEERYGIDNYRYAAILFDPEERKIGIRLTNDRSKPEEIFAVTSGGSNFVITAASFFREFNIPTDKTRRYKLTEEDDLLVIKLDS